jgi:excisionase family DNA binding protein
VVGKGSDNPMLTTEEVAKWLGIAPRTVCTWAECGALPAIKVGRQWRFNRERILLCLQNSQLLEKKHASSGCSG